VLIGTDFYRKACIEHDFAMSVLAARIPGLHQLIGDVAAFTLTDP